MSCLVDIPGRYVIFVVVVENNEGGRDHEKMGGLWGKSEMSGGRQNSDQEIMYDRKEKKTKESRECQQCGPVSPVM